MSKFCTECGSALEEGSSFCTECGAAVAQETEADKAAGNIFFAESEKTDSENVFGTAPAAPAKPMPKGVKIGLIVAAALAVVLFAVSKIFGGIYSTESVSEKFITALTERDAAAIIETVAVSDESIVLSEENLAPLFALCDRTPDMIDTYANYLSVNGTYIEDGNEQNAEYPFTFNVKDCVLFKKYQVCINTCSLYVETPLANTTVTVDGQTYDTTPINTSNAGAAYDESNVYFAPVEDLGSASVTVYGLLPGLYTVDCLYTDYFGNEITASNEIFFGVRESSVYPTMDFAYSTVYNCYAYDISVSCGEGAITVGPMQNLTLYPVASYSTVTITCDPVEGTHFEDSYAVADSTYHEPYFQSCSLFVKNDYCFEVIPTVTTPSGNEYDLDPVFAVNSNYYTLIPANSKVDLKPTGLDAVPSPAYETVPTVLGESGEEVIYAYFYIAEGDKQALADYITEYTNETFVYMKQNDTQSLYALPMNTYLAFLIDHIAPTYNNYKTSFTITIPEEYQLPLYVLDAVSGYIVYTVPQFNVDFVFVDTDGEEFKESYSFSDVSFYFGENGWTYLPE